MMADLETPVVHVSAPNKKTGRISDTLYACATGMQTMIDLSIKAHAFPTSRQKQDTERLRQIQIIYRYLARLHEAGDIPDCLARITARNQIEAILNNHAYPHYDGKEGDRARLARAGITNQATFGGARMLLLSAGAEPIVSKISTDDVITHWQIAVDAFEKGAETSEEDKSKATVLLPLVDDVTDAQRLRDMFEMLAPGGRIVAVIATDMFTLKDQASQEFQAWFKTVQADSFAVPHTALPTSEWQNALRARIVVATKYETSEEDDAPASTALVLTDYSLMNNPVPDSAPPPRLTKQLDLDTLLPNPFQPRTSFPEQPLQDLARSMKSDGQYQPIVARPAAGGKFEIAMGERRARAARLAGMTTIRAEVDPSITDLQMAQWAIAENDLREPLNPIERAKGYSTLIKLGKTQLEIKQESGVDQPTISKTIHLLDLPSPVQELLSDRKISATHGFTLLRLLKFQGVEASLIKFAQDAVASSWSVSKLDLVISDFIADLERSAASPYFNAAPPDIASTIFAEPGPVAASAIATSQPSAGTDVAELETAIEEMRASGATDTEIEQSFASATEAVIQAFSDTTPTEEQTVDADQHEDALEDRSVRTSDAEELAGSGAPDEDAHDAPEATDAASGVQQSDPDDAGFAPVINPAAPLSPTQIRERQELTDAMAGSGLSHPFNPIMMSPECGASLDEATRREMIRISAPVDCTITRGSEDLLFEMGLTADQAIHELHEYRLTQNAKLALRTLTDAYNENHSETVTLSERLTDIVIVRARQSENFEN